MHQPNTSCIAALLCGLLIPAGLSISAEGDTQKHRQLSLDERIACTERIEDVYWSYRIWPSENPGPKPPRETVVSRDDIASKVELSGLHQAALTEIWGETVSSKMIQAELDRIARATRQPKLLHDVFAALNNDPFLVAECFVRPRLAERLAHKRFSWDRGIHQELRERATTALANAGSARALESSGAEVVELSYVQDESFEAIMQSTATPREIHLSATEWDAVATHLAQSFPHDPSDSRTAETLTSPGEVLKSRVGSGFSPLHEDAESFSTIAVLEAADTSMKIAAATWRKQSYHAWLRQSTRSAVGHSNNATSDGTAYTLPTMAPEFICQDDSWLPTAETDVTSRRSHSAVWTGTEMIVWGGWGAGTSTMYTDSGGRYSPSTDDWLPTSMTNVPMARGNHSAVWTGSAMLIWGGDYFDDNDSLLDTGSRYDPGTDTWVDMSTTEAASPRRFHSTVWTGTEMIVWGGQGEYQRINTGGRYNPTADSWSPTSLTWAPATRAYHSAVWTGSEMLVWGGQRTSTSYTDTGGRYDPSADTWSLMDDTTAPSGRAKHHAVWTGSTMVVWGGDNGISLFDSGGRYDPVAGFWTSTSLIGAPTPGQPASTVWTGTEMIVWGGYYYEPIQTGGRYNPATDEWRATTTEDAPTARYYHTAVWADPEMIVWGGNDGHYQNTGGRYCASGVTDTIPPSNPGINASDPPISTWSADNTVEVSWSGASDNNVGVAGYSVLFDQSPTTFPDATLEVAHTADPHIFVSEPLADGAAWTFHLLTFDAAGNSASPVHAGPFWIDATPPSAPPDLRSTSHGVDASGDPTIDVVWGASADATSLVDGYALAFTQEPTWSCSQLKIVEETTTSATSAHLADGSWYGHVCAVDHAGSWSNVSSDGPYVVDSTLLIFEDGFEDGTTDRWSATAPTR